MAITIYGWSTRRPPRGQTISNTRGASTRATAHPNSASSHQLVITSGPPATAARTPPAARGRGHDIAGAHPEKSTPYTRSSEGPFVPHHVVSVRLGHEAGPASDARRSTPDGWRSARG
jgi:hypothetical protein